MTKIELSIQGMTGQNRGPKVTIALRSVRQVALVQVDLPGSRAAVEVGGEDVIAKVLTPENQEVIAGWRVSSSLWLAVVSGDGRWSDGVRQRLRRSESSRASLEVFGLGSLVPTWPA